MLSKNIYPIGLFAKKLFSEDSKELISCLEKLSFTLNMLSKKQT